MSVKLLAKLAAAFSGPIADTTQIATTTDDNSPRLNETLATIENNSGNIPQVIQDIANASTIAHEAGDIIYDTGFDKALEVKIKNRTDRLGNIIGDSDGITLDSTGNINGWQSAIGDWRNTIIGVHIAELNTPSSGTRPLLKWRSGDTSFTLLGVTSQGYLFVNDPTTSVDSAVATTNLAEGNILSDEFGSVEVQVGDHITLEIIIAGTGAISFVPTYTRNNVTTQLNFIQFNNAGDFNLNQIHLEHNLTATAFDRIILAHTNSYLNRQTYTNDLSTNVDSDIYNFRREGEGAAYIEVDTPIAFPQFESVPTIYGFTAHGINFRSTEESPGSLRIYTTSTATAIMESSGVYALALNTDNTPRTKQDIIDFINADESVKFPWTVAIASGNQGTDNLPNSDFVFNTLYTNSLISGGGGRLINSDEQQFITKLTNFEETANDGKILGIEGGVYAVVDAPSGGGGGGAVVQTPDVPPTAYLMRELAQSRTSFLQNLTQDDLDNDALDSGPAWSYQTLTIPAGADIPSNERGTFYIIQSEQVLPPVRMYIDGTNELHFDDNNGNRGTRLGIFVGDINGVTYRAWRYNYAAPNWTGTELKINRGYVA